MPGANVYTDSELLRMQREAEARVRDMQSRARQTVNEANRTTFVRPGSGWTSNRNGTGYAQQGNRQRQQEQRQQELQQQEQRQQEQRQQEQREQQREQPPPRHTPPITEEPKEIPIPQDTQDPDKKTTIVEDIMSALNLDEDYILIIGLILILINQRADTTLILALAYLLI